MIELKRINDICPVCGRKFIKFNMKFSGGYCTNVRATCSCGYSMKTISCIKGHYDFRRNIYETKKEDEDAIDKWNKVNHE